MRIVTLISLLILGGFIALGIRTFGLLTSYSSYSAKWMEKHPMSGLHLWSIVTFSAAFLMIPPMIEVGDGNVLQFLGFFAPLYLIVVSLTPEYSTNDNQRKVHVVGAWLCAILAFAWMIFVCGAWYIPISVLVAVAFMAYKLNRKDAYIFWGEVVMFASVYLTLMIKL